MTRQASKKITSSNPMRAGRTHSGVLTHAQYIKQVLAFDAALCEAIAVSQAQAGRVAEVHIGYAGRVYAKLCSHGIAMIRAVPLSRWTSSVSENWDFSCVAGHARAILEGCLLFNNLVKAVGSDDERKTRMNIMHLNDCTRRVELMRDVGAEDKIPDLEKQQEELRNRLRQSTYFKQLPLATQTRCLKGKNLTVETREEGLAEIGYTKSAFDGLFDLYSQHTHILPLSFYQMETNGRGTGVENDIDRSYIAYALGESARILKLVADMMVLHFPDIAEVRQGVNSKFFYGPTENLPNIQDTGLGKAEAKRLTDNLPSKLSQAIKAAWSPNGNE